MLKLGIYWIYVGNINIIQVLLCMLVVLYLNITLFFVNLTKILPTIRIRK